MILKSFVYAVGSKKLSKPEALKLKYHFIT